MSGIELHFFVFPLQADEVIEHIDASLCAGGYQRSDHITNIRSCLGFAEHGIVSVSYYEFELTLHFVVVQHRYRYANTQNRSNMLPPLKIRSDLKKYG